MSSTQSISRAHSLALEINGVATRGVRRPDDSWGKMACLILPVFVGQKFQYKKTSFVSGAKIPGYLPWMQFSVLLWIQTFECSARRASAARKTLHRNCMEYNDEDATANCNNQIKSIYSLYIYTCIMLSPTVRPQHL